MKIKIYTHRVIHNHAHELCRLLNTMGHEAVIVTEVDPADPTLHIIYVAFSAATPPNYILFQTEIYGNHWWTDSYRDQCRAALQIWDYSQCNLDQYDFGNPKFLMQPFEFEVGEMPHKDIELLFYGYVNYRRKPLLEAIRRRSRIAVTMVEDTYGAAMLDILKRTKIVLNIHAQDDSPQEIFRITEALSCGCRVLSEGQGRHDASGRIRYLNDLRNWDDHFLFDWPLPSIYDRYQPDISQIEHALSLIKV